MTTPTLRELIEEADAVITALLGYCSDQTSTAKDAIGTLEGIRASLAAQPELPEPVAHLKKNGFKFNADIEPDDYETEVKLYTAAQLQQAVEQATAKSVESANEWQDVERLAANRYRPVPDGFSYKVAGGDGTRSLWHGTQDECRLFAAKLTEAFLDGAFIQRQQAQAKREPMGDTDLARLFREIYGGTRFGESERLLARAIEAHHGIGGKA